MKIGMMLLSILLCQPGIEQDAYAGSAEGPYVVWFNLSQHAPATFDETIRSYLNSGDDLRWNSEALMYMRKRPAEIASTLVSNALLKKEKTAQKTLANILKKPFDEVPGFDGLILFIDNPRPQFIGFSTNGRLHHNPISNMNNIDSISVALCNVMPQVKRHP